MAKSQASNPGKSSKPSSQLLSVKKSKKSAVVDSVDSEKENNLEPSKKRILIHWSKLENFHITDALLTLIEGSVTWKGVFGFDKGTDPDPTPTGKGKSLAQHCADIATALFLTEDSEWSKDDLGALRSVVKNWVASLKSTYMAFCQDLGETGHGLVASGREGELQEGTTAANAWEVIQEKFPWYLHMHALMGTSPVVSRKAVANSRSAVDLSILDDEEEQEFCSPSPVGDADLCGSDPLSPGSTGGFFGGDVTPLKLKATIPSKCASDSPVVRSAKKCKGPQDFVADMAEAECQAHLQMNKTNAKFHIEREKIKWEAAHDTAITVECMCLEAQAEQAAAQHAHELLMMEKQIELARLCAGYPAPVIDPNLPH
ncbi:hypothetical protein EDD16DRAFT_1752153 [Pisolithus croceorrhizus]|nr:hypothetical protein EDD16DRAFT_1752153 [Pisolithus croceorrhizus]